MVRSFGNTKAMTAKTMAASAKRTERKLAETRHDKACAPEQYEKDWNKRS